MNNKETITLFTNMQIWYHKHILHLMIFFILTGLPLVSHNFSWLAFMFGVPFSIGISGNYANSEVIATGVQVCRIIHRFMAVIWILISIPFVCSMLSRISTWHILPKLRKEQGIIDYIKEGLMDNKRIYIDWQYPKHMGKYSFLQIFAAWAVIFICIIMMISGIFLWFRAEFSLDVIRFMRVLHTGGFILMILFLIFHVYFAVLPVNRAGYHAMFRDGKDTIEHARKKHPKLFQD